MCNGKFLLEWCSSSCLRQDVVQSNFCTAPFLMECYLSEHSLAYLIFPSSKVFQPVSESFHRNDYRAKTILSDYSTVLSLGLECLAGDFFQDSINLHNHANQKSKNKSDQIIYSSKLFMIIQCI